MTIRWEKQGLETSISLQRLCGIVVQFKIRCYENFIRRAHLFQIIIEIGNNVHKAMEHYTLNMEPTSYVGETNGPVPSTHPAWLNTDPILTFISYSDLTIFQTLYYKNFVCNIYVAALVFWQMS